MRETTIFEKGNFEGVDYKIIGINSTGKSHIKNGIENQDSFGFRIGTEGIMISVADGLGSCKNSKVGSEKAIETVKELHELIEKKKIKESSTSDMKDFAIAHWKSIIMGDLNDFSTTLKFAFLTKAYIIMGGIGDGEAFASIDGNEFSMSGHSDLFSNITYAMTKDIDEDKFEIVKLDLLPETKVINIFMATDGITFELKNGVQKDLMNHLEENVKKKGANYEKEISTWINDLHEKNGDDKTMLFLTSEWGIL